MFFQQLINGITLGGIYALISLGYTMVYGVLLMINFAHSEIFMLGAYIGFFVLVLLGPLIKTQLVLALLLAFLGAILFSGLSGVVIERFA